MCSQMCPFSDARLQKGLGLFKLHGDQGSPQSSSPACCHTVSRKCLGVQKLGGMSGMHDKSGNVFGVCA